MPAGRSNSTTQPTAGASPALVMATSAPYPLLQTEVCATAAVRRAAAEAGVPILIDSDAHSTRNFELMRYGVATARRAWLTREHVANTRSWPEFAALRKRARRG